MMMGTNCCALIRGDGRLLRRSIALPIISIIGGVYARGNQSGIYNLMLVGLAVGAASSANFQIRISIVPSVARARSLFVLQSGYPSTGQSRRNIVLSNDCGQLFQGIRITPASNQFFSFHSVSPIIIIIILKSSLHFCSLS